MTSLTRDNNPFFPLLFRPSSSSAFVAEALDLSSLFLVHRPLACAMVPIVGEIGLEPRFKQSKRNPRSTLCSLPGGRQCKAVVDSWMQLMGTGGEPSGAMVGACLERYVAKPMPKMVCKWEGGGVACSEITPEGGEQGN